MEQRLKGKHRTLRNILILLAVVAAGICWDTARYAHTEDRKPKSEMIVATYDADRIRVGPETEILIIVQTDPKEQNTAGMLFAYSRTVGEDGTAPAWKDEIIGVSARLGRGGLGKTAVEDGRTPEGMYGLDMPGGSGSPLEGFPETYRQSEEDGPERKYCLRICWQPENEAEGADVFLQCLNENAESTDGGVAVDEKTMENILRLYREQRTCILIEEKGRFSQYY